MMNLIQISFNLLACCIKNHTSRNNDGLVAILNKFFSRGIQRKKIRFHTKFPHSAINHLSKHGAKLGLCRKLIIIIIEFKNMYLSILSTSIQNYNPLTIGRQGADILIQFISIASIHFKEVLLL